MAHSLQYSVIIIIIQILKTRIDEPSKEGDKYPPRIRISIGPSNPPPLSSLMCNIPIQGIESDDVQHTFGLTVNYDGVRTQGQYEPNDRCTESHHASLLSQLAPHAAQWRGIGTHLGFQSGELDAIESKPGLFQQAPESWLNAMLAQWLQWAPGDGRRSDQVATLSSLKRAVGMAGLGATAAQLHH